MIDFEEIEDLGYEDNNEENDNGFSIVSDLQAEHFLKKIKKAAEEKDRLVDLANKEIEDLTKQIEAFEEKYKNDTGFLRMKLFEYFTKVEHKETKTQESYKLLSGSLVLKKPTQKMVKNDEKLAEFLEGYAPEYIEVVKKPKWGEFKKELSIQDGKVINNQTGEVVPDDVVSLEDAPGEFDVKF